MKKIPNPDHLPLWLVVVIIIVLPLATETSLVNAHHSSKTLLFAFVLLVLVVLRLSAIISGRTAPSNLKRADILIGLYLLYVCINQLFLGYSIATITIIETVCLVLLYFEIRQTSRKNMPFILIALLTGGIMQAVYGNLQLHGFYPSNHGVFKLTGSFFNPGPYAGYLASILPLAFAFYITFNKKNKRNIAKRFLRLPVLKTGANGKLQLGLKQFYVKPDLLVRKLLNFLGIAALIAILLVLPATRSRASWLAGLAGCGYLVWHFRRKISWWSSTQLSRLSAIQKRGLTTIVFLTILVALFFIYQFKKDSADGRLLIWRVAGNMIEEQPITGHGIDQFQARYMNYQAAFFMPKPDVPEGMIADNTIYAFNEFIKLTTEQGVVGLMLVLGVLFALFWGRADFRSEIQGSALSTTSTVNRGGNSRIIKESSREMLSAARAGLLAMLVFGMFSYPSEILLIKINFVVLAGMVASFQRPVHFRRGHNAIDRGGLRAYSIASYLAFVGMLIFIIPAGRVLYNQYHAYRQWEEASEIYSTGSYQACLDDYEQAFHRLKNNGTFLVHYGKALSMAEEHEKAVEVLEGAKTHMNNTVLYTALGVSYQALGQIKKAEKSFQHAGHMVPNRFFPLYLLAKLYDDTGQAVRATDIARQVLGKAVKVPSKAIEEIKAEMQQILEKNASSRSNKLIEGQRQEAHKREQTASCLPLLLKRKGGDVTKIII